MKMTSAWQLVNSKFCKDLRLNTFAKHGLLKGNFTSLPYISCSISKFADVFSCQLSCKIRGLRL